MRSKFSKFSSERRERPFSPEYKSSIVFNSSRTVIVPPYLPHRLSKGGQVSLGSSSQLGKLSMYLGAKEEERGDRDGHVPTGHGDILTVGRERGESAL